MHLNSHLHTWPVGRSKGTSFSLKTLVGGFNGNIMDLSVSCLWNIKQVADAADACWAGWGQRGGSWRAWCEREAEFLWLICIQRWALLNKKAGRDFSFTLPERAPHKGQELTVESVPSSVQLLKEETLVNMWGDAVFASKELQISHSQWCVGAFLTSVWKCQERKCLKHLLVPECKCCQFIVLPVPSDLPCLWCSWPGQLC